MKKTELTNDILIADALVRLKALENILVGKGILTIEEFNKEMEDVANKIAKSILQKSNVSSEEIDNIINSFKKDIN